MTSSSLPSMPRVNRVSGIIVNSAMKVHAILGPGLLESTYQACLAHELRKRGLRAEIQVALPVVYEGEKLDLGYRLDLLVEGFVVVEIKCVEVIHPRSQSSAPVVLAAERQEGRLTNQLLRGPFERRDHPDGRRVQLAKALTTGGTGKHRVKLLATKIL